MIKSMRMRLAGHGARMGAKRNAYMIFDGENQKRPRRRCVDNIKMKFACGLRSRILFVIREIGWGAMVWIELAEDRDQWRALMYTVLNLRVP
jgi:hypothetical protein